MIDHPEERSYPPSWFSWKLVSVNLELQFLFQHQMDPPGFEK